MVDSPHLSTEACALRRQRLVDTLQTRQLDAALISDVRDIYYFCGLLLPADLPALLFLDCHGASIVIAPEDDGVGQHDAVYYTWNHRGTRHPDPVRGMINAARQRITDCQKLRVGVQESSLNKAVYEELLASPPNDTVAIDELIAQIQQRKDEDEISVLRHSVRANLGAYDAVRDAIHPGANELDVLAAGYRGAMIAAGEKVLHDGDYQCGMYNGPARDRQIVEGELYIVDAWTCFRGYWSDMSRTYFVGKRPNEIQYELFEHIRNVHRQVANLLKPGIDGKEVYETLDALIRQHPRLADQGLIHHGGHAIGLRSHEMPDINLNRGGKLEPGNVICVEPGGYFPEAKNGVRLENMYLITDNGCEDLCLGEVELVCCS